MNWTILQLCLWIIPQQKRSIIFSKKGKHLLTDSHKHQQEVDGILHRHPTFLKNKVEKIIISSIRRPLTTVEATAFPSLSGLTLVHAGCPCVWLDKQPKETCTLGADVMVMPMACRNSYMPLADHIADPISQPAETEMFRAHRQPGRTSPVLRALLLFWS